MNYFPTSIAALIEEFAKLPGVGRKSAQRLALHVVDLQEEQVSQFISALREVKQKVHYCKKCFHLTDEELCPVCSNPSRKQQVICVVDTPKDLLAIEKTREYKGLYHVLHGRISPLDGIGPNDLKIKDLLVRLSQEEIEEVILANSPTVEGEATAVYLSKLLQPLGLTVSRIAHGVPIGGDLEFADEVTLTKALEGRHKL